ncbi:MAG: AMP-binding protein [Bryobacteraceae bacterium]|nr:AMP-binding protein [Bryobacteraceae bacterium]MDW8377167.1 AMP-binding protein [Bryobacterales bacterium]
MPFRSPYPDISVPDVSLPDFIFSNLGEAAGRTALIDGPTGRSYTYAQVDLLSRRVAGALAKRGLGKGDKLAILSPNVPEYAIAVHGVMRAGGIVTTMNPLYTESEVEHQLRDSEARFLLTVPQLLDKAAAAVRRCNVERIFVLGEAEGAEPFAQLMGEPGEAPAVEIHPAEDVAAMLYSSGTTGLPKGVMLTHRNLVAALLQADKLFGEGPARSLLFLPMFHIFGFHAVMNFDLLNRGTIVTMPRFDFEQMLALVAQHRIERMCVVPPVVLALVKSPVVEQYDTSSLRLVFSGAAPLDEALAAACEQRLKGCLVRQGYGLTETSPPVCGHPLTTDRVRYGSVGPLVPSTEGRLVNLETGDEAAPGETGELWVRGPQVMKGYYRNPEATRDMLLEGGWLRTGDIARLDEAGWLYIVDRAKELIKYKGLQVAPAELEAVLVSHPMVADAAVIGVPDEEAGEAPKAFVVAKGPVTADEILQFVASQVAPYKKVRYVEFVDAIPKSPSGKILRRVLRERERARS